MLNFFATILISLIIFVVPAVANAEPIDVTDIFSSSTTIEGDSFNYPAGKAEMRLVRGEFEEGFMASPAVTGNALILRTKSAVYRVE